jgi:hypothetical protein
LIRSLTLIAFTTASLVAAPVAVAQDARGRPDLTNPGQLGVTATTPSRMDRSRREMNRGRNPTWRLNMTPAQLLTYAENTVAGAGFECRVTDVVLVGQTIEGAPLVEVDCARGGGLVIADTDPVMAADCLDLGPDTGLTMSAGARLDACRLPGNVASVNAEREGQRRQAAAN